MINLSELISKDASISGKLRIHYSPVPVEQLEDKTSRNAADIKPRGLWYGFGREWIDYVEGNSELRHKRGRYIYFVKVHNLKRVLQLSGIGDILKFSKEYADWRRGNSYLIDWAKVTKRYSGIEINPHSDAAQRYANGGGGGTFNDLMWYRDWDVASGCMWDLNNISIKLIFPRQKDDKT